MTIVEFADTPLPTSNEILNVRNDRTGQFLRILKNRGGDYRCRIDGNPRVRFGNATDIRQDAIHFLRTGSLPKERPVC